MNAKRAGAAGGKETLRRYGKDHFREIGRKGFAATVARHWAGDRLAYRRYLVARSWNAVLDALAERELDRRLRDGADVACVEVAVIDEEGEIPW